MMTPLDYGTRFTLDAFRPNEKVAAPTGEQITYLEELHDLLAGPGSRRVVVHVEDDEGLSVGISGGESHLALHLFPGLQALTLHVFSRREVRLKDLTDRLTGRFGVGRFDSHLGNATKSLPQDPDRLRHLLAGDRCYARVRLDDSLLAC